MLDEYSIEQRAARIFDPRSKEYFAEVLSGYEAGHYRSAVVMLWSVVVCDLLFKLEDLDKIYDDDKARGILGKIGKLQKDNERSPVWESTLVDLVAESTQLLDNAERENLLHLQRQRHLAAHPVVNADLQLHRPNRDTARALIRNALDGLLTKAPILSRRIVGDLVGDLERISGILTDGDKELKAYLESKYYSRFNLAVEKAVFRDLWKFVFQLTNEECEKNRAINYKALSLLYDRNPEQFRAQISDERDRFSAIAEDGDPLVWLIYFLSRPNSFKIYGLLADHAKTVIEHTTDVSSRCLAWFTAGNLRDHAEHLKKLIVEGTKVGHETWDALWEISDSPEWEKSMVQLASAYYVASPSFDDADERFNAIIRPMLSVFELEDCIELIQGIETNRQTWDRRGSRKDHGELRTRVLEIDPTANLAKYSNFNQHFV